MVSDCTAKLPLLGLPADIQTRSNGNRKDSSSVPYVRTEQSTKSKLASNVDDGKTGPNRTLFNIVRDIGVVFDIDNTSAFQRNARQALYEKQKSTTCASRTGTKKTKDVLASVLELQKGACKGSIHDAMTY